ncbi:hypothetical protein HK104_003159 [Borealophlyctis nickersoniae]|nr:hypothetical protein HK104_003159 [Borealophlyctis nickersoniae]
MPLNVALLEENARLRGKCQQMKLQRETADTATSTFEDISSLPGIVKHARTAGRVLEEVQRLLEAKGKKDQSDVTSVRFHVVGSPTFKPAKPDFLMTQTLSDATENNTTQKSTQPSQASNPDSMSDDKNTIVAQNAAICELKRERDQLKTSLSSQSQLVSTLQKSLTETQRELNQLLQKYQNVAQRAEAALSAEKKYKDTILEQKEVIANYAAQLVEAEGQTSYYKGELDRLNEQHIKYRAAQRVVNQANERNIEHLKAALERATSQQSAMSHSGASTQQPKRLSDDAPPSESDPLDVAAYKAEAIMYRDRYDADMAVLRKVIADQESENEDFRKRVEEIIGTMHSDEEWTRLVAKYEISQCRVRELEGQYQGKKQLAESLQERCFKLTTDLESLQTEMRRAKETIVKKKVEIVQKDALVKDYHQKITELIATNAAHEEKLKNLSTVHLHKEALVANWKSKNEELSRQVEHLKNVEKDLNTAREALKKCKADLQRKDAMLKTWKERCDSCAQELANLKSSTSTLIDPKVHSSTEEARRAAERRMGMAERERQALARREEQLRRGVGKVVEGWVWWNRKNEFRGEQGQGDIEGWGGANAEIEERAREISKTILNLDFSSIVAPATQTAASKTLQHLECILAREDFESDLVEFLCGLFLPR